MKEFNINEYIFVQLTESGRAEHKRQHEEFRKNHPSFVGDYVQPKEDDMGWSKWQGWVLMNTFGAVLDLGFNPPFSPTIKIDV
jgi:hypothetical protein